MFSTLHKSRTLVVDLEQNATNEVVDNEATNDNKSFDMVLVVNVPNDTQAIGIQNEITQAIDGPLSNRLKETTPSTTSLPTNHDT